MLAGPFGRHDDGMVAAFQAFLQRGQQAAFPFEGEGRFRDQDEVHFLHGQRGLGGDEARFPAHELDQTNAVGHALGLGMGAFDGLGGLEDGGLEAEGLGDEVDVVVDGLGDADDGDLEVARLHFTADAQGGLHAAVTADDEQDADVGTLQAVHDLFRGLGPA